MQYSFDKESVQLVVESMQAESLMRAMVSMEDELITDGHDEYVA